MSIETRIEILMWRIGEWFERVSRFFFDVATFGLHPQR